MANSNTLNSKEKQKIRDVFQSLESTGQVPADFRKQFDKNMKLFGSFYLLFAVEFLNKINISEVSMIRTMKIAMQHGVNILHIADFFYYRRCSFSWLSDSTTVNLAYVLFVKSADLSLADQIYNSIIAHMVFNKFSLYENFNEGKAFKLGSKSIDYRKRIKKIRFSLKPPASLLRSARNCLLSCDIYAYGRRSLASIKLTEKDRIPAEELKKVEQHMKKMQTLNHANIRCRDSRDRPLKSKQCKTDENCTWYPRHGCYMKGSVFNAYNQYSASIPTWLEQAKDLKYINKIARAIQKTEKLTQKKAYEHIFKVMTQTKHFGIYNKRCGLPPFISYVIIRFLSIKHPHMCDWTSNDDIGPGAIRGALLMLGFKDNVAKPAAELREKWFKKGASMLLRTITFELYTILRSNAFIHLAAKINGLLRTIYMTLITMATVEHLLCEWRKIMTREKHVSGNMLEISLASTDSELMDFIKKYKSEQTGQDPKTYREQFGELVGLLEARKSYKKPLEADRHSKPFTYLADAQSPKNEKRYRPFLTGQIETNMPTNVQLRTLLKSSTGQTF